MFNTRTSGYITSNSKQIGMYLETAASFTLIMLVDRIWVCSKIDLICASPATGVYLFTILSSRQSVWKVCSNDKACDDVNAVDPPIMVSYHRSVFHPPSHGQHSDSRGCVSFAILLGCLSYSYKIILIKFLMILMAQTLSSSTHFSETPLIVIWFELFWVDQLIFQSASHMVITWCN